MLLSWLRQRTRLGDAERSPLTEGIGNRSEPGCAISWGKVLWEVLDGWEELTGEEGGEEVKVNGARPSDISPETSSNKRGIVSKETGCSAEGVASERRNIPV